jgi:hypothetical protein
MKTFIILLSFLFVGNKGIAQDWVLVGADSDNNNWYIKSSYVSKDGYDGTSGNIKIWTKKELKKTSVKKNGKTLTYTNAKELQLVFADCNDRKIKFVTTTVYNSAGKVISSWTLADYQQEWIDVVPDSMGESMIDKICELFN